MEKNIESKNISISFSHLNVPWKNNGPNEILIYIFKNAISLPDFILLSQKSWILYVIINYFIFSHRLLNNKRIDRSSLNADTHQVLIQSKWFSSNKIKYTIHSVSPLSDAYCGKEASLKRLIHRNTTFIFFHLFWSWCRMTSLHCISIFI